MARLLRTERPVAILATFWLLILPPCLPAQAQSVVTPAEERYAEWRAVPFTCHDLVVAQATKDSIDEDDNQSAIFAWIQAFPKLAERRDRINDAALQTEVLKWCSDAQTSGSGNTPLPDVVEKAWLMLGY